MFQISMSVENARADWLYSLDDVVRNKLTSCVAVSALNRVGRRSRCSFGCEDECATQMLAAIKNGLVELFGVVCKYEFIKSNLSLGLPQMNYDILLHTLVAFDRENEHKLLTGLVEVSDGMTIDGFFDFRLGELKERWLEICKLTRTNGAYLYDDETYNELLKFLISAVNPKVNKLVLCEREGRYRLTGALKNKVLEIDTKNGSELLYYIIDLAPLELIIDGGISNMELADRLIGIFDAKMFNAAKNQTKK